MIASVSSALVGSAARILVPQVARAVRGSDTPFDRELHRCASAAIRRAVTAAAPDLSVAQGDELAHVLAGALAAAGESTNAILPADGNPFPPARAMAAWEQALAERLDSSEMLDLRETDASQLVLAFSEFLWEELRQSARLPDSPVANLVLQVTLDGLSAGPTDAPVGQQAANLHLRPKCRSFVGRVELAAELVERVQIGDGGLVALTGPSGVGKSELAAHVLRQVEPQPRIAWWVNADSRATVVADLSDLAEALGLSSTGDPVAAVRRHLSMSGGWVLVLDGCEDEALAAEFAPAIDEGGFVLATALSPGWGASFDRIVVPPLDDQAALDLLSSWGSDPSPALGRVVALLGGLPLALEQAARYMASAAISSGRYEQLLTERATQVLDRGGLATHPTSVSAAFEIALRRASSEYPGAVNVLTSVALCGADVVPIELLSHSTGSPDPMLLADVIASLGNVALLQTTPAGVACHSIVRMLARDRADAGETSNNLVGLFKSLTDLRRTTDVTPAQVSVHLESMLAQGEAVPRPLVARALTTASMFLRDHGRSDPAMRYAELAVSCCRDSDEQMPEDEFAARLALGRAQSAKGLLDDAEATLGELSKRCRIASSWRIGAAALNDLGNVAHLRGDLSRTLDLFEQARRAAERVEDDDERGAALAAFYANRANLERDIGRPSDAVASLREAHRLVGESEGRSPELAVVMSNLALALQEAGQLAEAERVIREALEVDTELLGDMHPAVGRDLNNLGLILHERGNLRAALDIFEKASVVLGEVHGARSRAMATVHNNIGRIEADLEEYDRALAQFDDALAIQEGWEAWLPDVATTLCNRAGVYGRLFRQGEAMRDLQRAYRIDLQVYGDRHLEVAVDANNIGQLLAEMGLFPAARKWFELALEIADHAVGRDHPAFAHPLLSRALLRAAAGDRETALIEARAAAGTFRAVLGENHSTTRNAEDRVRELL